MTLPLHTLVYMDIRVVHDVLYSSFYNILYIVDVHSFIPLELHMEMMHYQNQYILLKAHVKYIYFNAFTSMKVHLEKYM